jgi:hypothetical protein
MALPKQTRCLSCNARIQHGAAAEKSASEAIQTVPPPPSGTDGKCPGCGKNLAVGAVLCIECGYDLRSGRKRETVHALTDEEPPPDTPRRKRNPRREALPAGFARVRQGLGFHYARLVLTLLGGLVVMGLLCYGWTVKPRPDDPILAGGGWAALGIVSLAALVGLAGSVLCLWVGRVSRAWWFIFLSLLLDVLTLPVAAYLQVADLPVVLAWAVEFVSWILFMLFLRRLALHIDRPSEADEVMRLITRGVALLVAVPLFLVLLAQFAILYAFAGSQAAHVLLVVSWGIVIVQVLLLIQLVFSILGNLQTLRETIAIRLPAREQEKEEPQPVRSGE